MKLYRTKTSVVVEHEGSYYRVEGQSFDSLVCDEDLFKTLSKVVSNGEPLSDFDTVDFCAPIESQEVWAAGVTYYRSRSARIEESQGGGDFYDRVYSAERPELFFKAMPRNVVGPGAKVKIRRDATWSVPEPELALLINPKGEIVGYTIGNDMSSRDIEGLNPLYLPQAKAYDNSCGLGPCVVVQKERISTSTNIKMDTVRDGQVTFTGTTALTELKRDIGTLVEYLYRENTFPHGCFLLTGTGIVPPDDFTLRAHDEIRISIDGIGTLVNTVAP